MTAANDAQTWEKQTIFIHLIGILYKITCFPMHPIKTLINCHLGTFDLIFNLIYLKFCNQFDNRIAKTVKNYLISAESNVFIYITGGNEIDIYIEEVNNMKPFMFSIKIPNRLKYTPICICLNLRFMNERTLRLVLRIIRLSDQMLKTKRTAFIAEKSGLD